MAGLAAGCSNAGKNRLNRWLGRTTTAGSLLPPPDSADASRILTGVPVLVTPPLDLSREADGKSFIVANAIAARLVAEDVLATTRNAATQSYILSSKVEGLTLVAALTRPDGIGAGVWRVPLDKVPSALDRPALEVLGARVADAVLGNTAPASAAASAPAAAPARRAAPSIVVDKVTGAPGDGNKALAAAIRQALAVGGLAVLEKPRDNSLAVAGKVTVTALTPQIDHVVLAWEVRSPEGKVVATITQENDVPSGSLNNSWGPIAGAAAQGGADGILQLVAALRNP